jgi:hypothetical protein
MKGHAQMKTTTLEFKWTISRGRDTYGYNVCTLYADGRKVARCNGGGYDMQGTCLGNFIASHYADRLLTLTPDQMPEQSHYDYESKTRVEDGRSFYGLCFIDPNYDPGKAVVSHAPVFGKDSDAGKTVAELEKDGKSLGLERYQAFYAATSKTPTDRHTVPEIDGACGMSSVQKIAEAIGLTFEYVAVRSKKLDLYRMHDNVETIPQTEAA